MRTLSNKRINRKPIDYLPRRRVGIRAGSIEAIVRLVIQPATQAGVEDD